MTSDTSPKALFRCMGGRFCSHTPGTCTATNMEYQAEAAKKAPPAPALRIEQRHRNAANRLGLFHSTEDAVQAFARFEQSLPVAGSAVDIEAAGEAAYRAYCACDPIEPDLNPDMGRMGYKAQSAVWQAVARAVLRTKPANPSDASERGDVEAEQEDPAYAKPLPPKWALDVAARNAGFRDWFSVPATFRTPTNRAVIVEARKIVIAYGEDELIAECRERASYLKAMESEGLSTLERQCMETLTKAAAALAALPTRDAVPPPPGAECVWPAGHDERAQEGRCPYCEGTGDVHRADGEWLGICDCPAGAALRSQGGAGREEVLVKWADDSDPEGELAIALAASAIEAEENVGEWTWRDIARAAIRSLKGRQ